MVDDAAPPPQIKMPPKARPSVVRHAPTHAQMLKLALQAGQNSATRTDPKELYARYIQALTVAMITVDNAQRLTGAAADVAAPTATVARDAKWKAERALVKYYGRLLALHDSKTAGEKPHFLPTIPDWVSKDARKSIETAAAQHKMQFALPLILSMTPEGAEALSLDEGGEKAFILPTWKVAKEGVALAQKALADAKKKGTEPREVSAKFLAEALWAHQEAQIHGKPWEHYGVPAAAYFASLKLAPEAERPAIPLLPESFMAIRTGVEGYLKLQRQKREPEQTGKHGAASGGPQFAEASPEGSIAITGDNATALVVQPTASPNVVTVALDLDPDHDHGPEA